MTWDELATELEDAARKIRAGIPRMIEMRSEWAHPPEYDHRGDRLRKLTIVVSIFVQDPDRTKR